MLKLDKKKINELLEFIILVVLFFIGIKKGGYYKQDSIIGICIIQLIVTVKYFFSIKETKKNNILNLVLLIFSISYMLPILTNNAATISGSINIWSRVYTFFLLFCVVQNSENKKKYKNGIIFTTLIIGILGIDELGLKLLDSPLKLIGSGYLEETTSKLSSVIQYSNLVGLLSIISSIFIAEKLIKIEHEDNKIRKKVLLNVLYTFLGIIVFLTESKMSIVLYIISGIVFLLMNKKYKDIIKFVLNIVFSFMVAVISSWIAVIIAIMIAFIYECCISNKKIANRKIIINIISIILLLLILVININYIKETDNIIRFKEYFSSFDSTKLRITYYTDALKLWSGDIKSILFGLGGNAFRTMYETVQTKEYISLEVHSLFIQILLESGIIGLVSIVFSIIYSILKGKDRTLKLILITVCVFATFDVYFTYSYMLFAFAILLALCDVETRIAKKSEIIIFGVITTIILIFDIKMSLGYIFEPMEVDNANNTLEQQEKIIKKCELSLFFDPYDLTYIENYTNACKTYLDIMDIKKQLYGEDDISKRIELVDKMYNNVNKELKYEKENKYALEDAIFVVYKYVDYLVMKNYDVNVLEGYEYYLDYIISNLKRIEENHKYNDAAKNICSNIESNVYNKFSTINLLLHSDKIQVVLDTIEEKENISL